MEKVNASTGVVVEPIRVETRITTKKNCRDLLSLSLSLDNIYLLHAYYNYNIYIIKLKMSNIDFKSVVYVTLYFYLVL